MNYQFKVGDKGKTRGGDNYEIIAVDARAERSIVALIYGDNRKPVVSVRFPDGRYVKNGGGLWGMDLMPPSRTVYVNLYGNGTAAWLKTEKDARSTAYRSAAIAVAIPVTYIEGQNLEIPRAPC